MAVGNEFHICGVITENALSQAIDGVQTSTKNGWMFAIRILYEMVDWKVWLSFYESLDGGDQ